MEKEIEKYFKKIRQKKITNKIIKQIKYEKRIISIIGILLIIYIIALFKSVTNNDDTQGILYIALWCIGYVVFCSILIHVFTDNKEFDNYSIQDQQFYLLYLLKHYMESTEYNKNSKIYLLSICRYYIRALNRQKNIIRSHNPFKVSEEELLLERIKTCFLDKVMGAINKQSNIEEVKRMIDILFGISIQGITLMHRESNINEINLEIKNSIKEYMDIDRGLPIVKDESSKIKNSIEFISRIMERSRKNSTIKVIVSTIIITSIYAVAEWTVNDEISILGIFSILLMAPPALIIFMNNFDKRNKSEEE